MTYRYLAGLEWPEDVPMNFEPRESKFTKRPLAEACLELVNELDRFGVEDATITADWSLSRRDEPLTDKRTPSPVAVHYVRNDKTFCIAICEYNTVTDNVWAIARTIESFRTIERHGGDATARRAEQSFAALPPPEDPWWTVLGIPRDSDPEVIEAVYKVKAKKYHPDNQATGDEDLFKKVQAAYDEAKKEAASGR